MPRVGKEARFFPAPGTPFNGYSKCKPKLEKCCGVSDWTLHDLRRTFASGLAAQGVAPPVIERLLNHVSGSFGGIVGVYQRYDFLPEMREAIARWEQHVLKLVDGALDLANVNAGLADAKEAGRRSQGSRSDAAPLTGS